MQTRDQRNHMDDLYKANRQVKNQGKLNVTLCVMVIVMMLISACTSNNKTHVSSKPEQPVGRVGNPLDIANMVLFLCSDKAGFITGENICIDGGMTKQMIYHAEHGWTLNEQ